MRRCGGRYYLACGHDVPAPGPHVIERRGLPTFRVCPSCGFERLVDGYRYGRVTWPYDPGAPVSDGNAAGEPTGLPSEPRGVGRPR